MKPRFAIHTEFLDVPRFWKEPSTIELKWKIDQLKGLCVALAIVAALGWLLALMWVLQ